MKNNSRKEITKEKYIPSLNTNTIVLKISYTIDDLKIFIRFINGNVINFKIHKYKGLTYSVIIDTIIDTIKTYTENKDISIIDAHGLSILKTLIENDWVIDSLENIDLVYYGIKSNPKYTVKFYNITKIPKELTESIPFKIDKNLFLIYNLKNRVNTLVSSIKKYLPNSVVIVDAECNLIVLNNTSIGSIMENIKPYIDSNLIEYKKIKVIRRNGYTVGTLDVENTYLNTDEAEVVLANVKSNDYYTSGNIIGKHITHTRFKRFIIRDNNTDKILKIIDMEYTLYKRNDTDVSGIIKEVEAYMKNHISSRYKVCFNLHS